MRDRLKQLPFAAVQALCRRHDLDIIATMPTPGALDPDGLERMLADGVGDMVWMAKHRDLRLDPCRILPGCRSVLAVALAYQPAHEHGGSAALKRARYAAGADYHKLMRRKLAAVARELQDKNGKPYPSRAVVDSAPVPERTLARIAGLGWIGRNGLLISPGRGSYHFLGFLFTCAPLGARHGGHGADRCGTCRLCHEACPTGALAGRRVLSERCISYLTIEHRGVIPKALAINFSGWWFGCDICQEVCPWNRFAPEAADSRLNGCDDERCLLEIDASSFDEYFAGRAVRRIGYERFRRNLLVALWSVGRTEDCKPILREELPLAVEQAAEIGLI